MPRHVDAAQRRTAIAGAALRVVHQEGFAAVTIRRVAAVLGASTTVVTHYVGSRDDLVRLAVGSLLERRQVEAEAAVAAAPEGRRVRRLLRWAALDVPTGDQQVWLDLVAGSRADPVLRTLLDGFNAWWDDLVAADLGADADPAVHDAVGVIADGLVTAAFDRGEPWTPARIEAALDRLLGPLGL